jgi:hypothetical protein
MEVLFTKVKETKNTIRYDETPQHGQPPIIGVLYVQKWFAQGRQHIAIQIPEADADAKRP